MEFTWQVDPWGSWDDGASGLDASTSGPGTFWSLWSPASLPPKGTDWTFYSLWLLKPIFSQEYPTTNLLDNKTPKPYSSNDASLSITVSTICLLAYILWQCGWSVSYTPGWGSAVFLPRPCYCVWDPSSRPPSPIMMINVSTMVFCCSWDTHKIMLVQQADFEILWLLNRKNQATNQSIVFLVLCLLVGRGCKMIHGERQHSVTLPAEMQIDILVDGDICLLHQWCPGLKVLPCSM